MSTVAPSAPAPVAVDASASATKGETVDPSAFAAEFESAQTSLAAAQDAGAQDAQPESAVALPPAAPLALAAAETVTPPPVAAAAPLQSATLPSATAEIPLPAGTGPADSASSAGPAAPISEVMHAAAEEPAVVVPATAAPLVAETGDEKEPLDDAPEGLPADAAPDLVLQVVPVPVPVMASAPTSAASASPVAAPPAPVGAPAAVTGIPDATAAAPDTTAAPAPTPAPAPAAPVAAPAVPALQTPDEVAAPAAPARAQAPDLVGQLSRPLHGLRSFGDGTHVITIRVNPESLGPVAVRAHVNGENMRIELVAPTEVARDAIKAILPDLRRDLSGAGGQATLDLSSGNQPSGRDSAPRDAQSSSRGSESVAAAPATGIRASYRTDVGLDVLA